MNFMVKNHMKYTIKHTCQRHILQKNHHYNKNKIIVNEMKWNKKYRKKVNKSNLSFL